MPELQDPGPSNRIKRKYGIKAPFIISSVAPELAPVTIVDDLTDQASFRTAIYGLQEAASVGNLSALNLRHGGGSSLIILEQIAVSTTVVASWQIRLNAVGLAVDDGAEWRDRRLPGSPEAIVSSGVRAATVGTRAAAFRSLADTTLVVPVEFILNPPPPLGASSIEVICTQVNIGITVTFVWKERDLEPTD